MSNENKKITVSIGDSTSLGKSKNTETTWKKFKDRFTTPVVTQESFSNYLAMSNQRQLALKGVNGWYMRGPVTDGRRRRNNVQPSDLITLDFDDCDPQLFEDLENGLILHGYELFWHTSRKHTPEKPRVRIIIPLVGKVDRDRYEAASRIIAQMIDPEMQYVDKVSFRPAQMMYFPTVSKNMKKYYCAVTQQGKLADQEKAITRWEKNNKADATDISQLPTTPDEGKLRLSADKMEDPLSKKGPVGVFCNTYSITELVEGKDGEKGILADVYEIVERDSTGAASRMSYIHGTSANGAVVYDDLFCYSHHGSDPTQDQTVNAFDLVRIHKFGKDDEDTEDDTSMSKRPSWKMMIEFCADDPNYKLQQAESNYDGLDMLDDDDVDYEGRDLEDEVSGEINDPELDDLMGVGIEEVTAHIPKPAKRTSRRRGKLVKPPKDWIAKTLDMSMDGSVKSTLHNVTEIIANDPRLWGKIQYNEFSTKMCLTDDFVVKSTTIPDLLVRDPVNGDNWQDRFSETILKMMSGPRPSNGGKGWGLEVTDGNLRKAISIVGHLNPFHPIKDYYDDVRKVKPTFDISTVLIRFFGAEDNAYTRQVSELMMIASVARIMNPGCKFDTGIILEGKQGIGKSSGIATLYGKDFFAELDADLGNRQKVAEQIAGKWALEMAELSALNKAESNHAKAFMSRQHDDVRMVFKQEVQPFPRQCVVWGTTNERVYLKDQSGNRRYWPINCGEDYVDVVGIRNFRDAIWCAAVHAYDAMVAEHGDNLPLTLSGKALNIGIAAQEGARIREFWEDWYDTILFWVDEEHRASQIVAELGGDELTVPEETQNLIGQRVVFTTNQIMQDVLDQYCKEVSSQQLQTAWSKCKAKLIEDGGWEEKLKPRNPKDPDSPMVHAAFRVGGTRPQRWFYRADMTAEEQKQGYRFVSYAEDPDHAQASESGDHQVDDDLDDMF
ncbi:virulence-associated E family protein [uncultured Roseobacter sp.]|uniref:virulence-associated E family protein n=1 Tax=uncultured Roseobacter sp. TaxID=114847 RepID=UPI002617065D|nr:virulence-associated E family protein [uncultured Roseobacter sp.]